MATHSSTLVWKSHGQNSLAGYSQWGHKESDTTEWLHYSCHVPARLLQSCLTLCDSIHWCPPGSSLRGISPNNNTGVGCCAFLQGIFPTQRLNPSLLCLLHWQEKKKSLFFFFKQAGSGQNFCSDILLVTFHFLPQRHPLRIAPECSFWCIFSGFPDSSVGKESACNAGDPGSISGVAWFSGEWKAYPLHCSGLENSKDCRFRHDWMTFTFL